MRPTTPRSDTHARRQGPRGALVGCVVVAGGCFDPSLPAPPPEVACLDDDDCPPPLVACVDGRCLGAGGDVTPPGVVPDSVALTPTTAGPGTTITVAFRTTEPLSGLPVVVAGDDEIRFDGAATGDDLFAFAGVVGAVADGPRPVVARLADAAGNDVEAVLGVVVVDTRPPVLDGVDVPDAIASDVPFTVQVHADELLGAARCTLRSFIGDDLPAVDAVVTGAQAACALRVVGIGSSFSLEVSLTDPVGNAAIFANVVDIVVVR